MASERENTEDITKIAAIDVFSKNVSVTYPKELDGSIDSLIDELNSALRRNIKKLCKLSITNAVEVVDNTGEAFFIMFDPKDDEEYTAEFMEQWNGGDIEELADSLDRWYSAEDAGKIAQACKDSLKGRKIGLKALHQLVAETAYGLGLYNNNFGNVYLAVKKGLKRDPKRILQFMYPADITIDIGSDKQAKYLISFETDWEPEHGIDWVIKGKNSICVGEDCNFFE